MRFSIGRVSDHAVYPLFDFLTRLFETGQPTVGQELAFEAADLGRCREFLIEWEAQYRWHLPPDPPAFDPDVALREAQTLYRGCQFLTHRDWNAEAIPQALQPPAPASAIEHYSADATLRFLPDLARLARSISRNDPLVERVLELGRSWPLSSVGMPELGDVCLDAIADHPGLWQLYLERVVARGDAVRAAEPSVREAIAAQTGIYPQLARTALGARTSG